MEVQDNRSIGNRVYNVVFKSTFGFALFSILMGIIVGGIILRSAGFPVLRSYGAMMKGIFGDPKAITWSIVRGTPLILTGLSVAFAFRTGLFNIGAEGQYIIGSIGAVLVGAFLPFQLPWSIHIPLTFLGGVLLAGVWGGIAGVLKARFGVHEVIATIMLNWIALYLLNYFVTLPGINKPNSETSYPIKESARIYMGWLRPIVKGAKANWGIVIAISIAALIGYILYKTTLGYELRAVGHNKFGAEYGGIPVNKSIISSMVIAGMLAGAAGTVMVMGVSFNVARIATMEGYGFDGIAVALIGNNTPIGAVLAGLFFGGLRQGSTAMQMVTQVPSEMINIIIGTIVFFIAIPNLIRMLFRTRKQRGG